MLDDINLKSVNIEELNKILIDFINININFILNIL